MTAVRVEKVATLQGHRDCLYTLAAGPEPARCFTAGGDGMIVDWDLRRPDQGRLLAQLPASCYALHYRPDRDLLLAGQNFDGLHAFRVADQTEVKSVRIEGAGEKGPALFDVQSVGDEVYVATGDGQLLLLDLATLTVRHRVRPTSQSARCVALHPTRPELAVGYSDWKVRIFHRPTLRPLLTLDAHQNSVFTVAYDPTGEHLLTAGRDARLKRWRVGEGYGLTDEVVAHMYAVNHVAFSPDGRHFATGSMDKSVKVWDAATFRLLKVIDKARHAGHGTSVNKLLWTDHAQQLLSASDDRRVSVWQLDFLL
ncbi:MAG: WD40 repeat domain-containing protein [Catalinimonas sp.]